MDIFTKSLYLYYIYMACLWRAYKSSIYVLSVRPVVSVPSSPSSSSVRPSVPSSVPSLSVPVRPVVVVVCPLSVRPVVRRITNCSHDVA